ncbi:DNA replication licensing factor MCM2-like isoform X1 [Magnolia sinica]|uniref:DNA replication licensing factor MCM2-like isoform X1 n=1 Tax=Magnolia sinica TaxID=86752 RepID=UPI002658490C|nr:DNA replication licensing factor MCM2-like isoform X1 [Magnolia sinica]
MAEKWSDSRIVRDEPDDADDEEEGEDLYNDSYMEDYCRMDEHDQYESVGLDDSMEDERDIDQIMEDRRAAEVELDAKEGNMGLVSRKLPRFYMIKTQMMKLITGTQKGLELISGRQEDQEAMMILMAEHQVHLEDHREDIQETMCQ